MSSVGDHHETVVSIVTTVENTKSLCGTVSTIVTVTATEVDLVELHVHSVTATVTVYGTVVSTQTGEHDSALTGDSSLGLYQLEAYHGAIPAPLYPTPCGEKYQSVSTGCGAIV